MCYPLVGEVSWETLPADLQRTGVHLSGGADFFGYCSVRHSWWTDRHLVSGLGGKAGVDGRHGDQRVGYSSFRVCSCVYQENISWDSQHIVSWKLQFLDKKSTDHGVLAGGWW